MCGGKRAKKIRRERRDESNSKNKSTGEAGEAKEENDDDAKPAGGSAQLHYACVCVCVCSRQTAKLTATSQSFWRVTSSNCAACVCVCEYDEGGGLQRQLGSWQIALLCECLQTATHTDTHTQAQQKQIATKYAKTKTNVVVAVREREREYAPSHAAAAIRKLQPAANSCEAAEAAAEAVVVAAGECEESVREECTMCVWCGGRRGADITCSFVQTLIEFHKLLALSVPFMCDALSFR